MNYKATLNFLFEQLPAYHRIGKAAYKDNLDNTISFDNYLGNPHKRFKTIHIAGTNGKGSVSHMIASVLQEAGTRTGLYTSPHLKDFRERIRVNGQMIPKRKVSGFINRHLDFISVLKPSFFELCVAMAFNYFEQMEVEVAVIETGLGGRLDSTNIILPVLSVITNIGHDHFDLLGDSLEKVAIEKAGIIKRGVPVVIGETQNGLDMVFRDKATRENAEITFADQEIEVAAERYSADSLTRDFIVRTAGKEITVRSPLTGNYQAANIATVFQSAKVLSQILGITNENILKGIDGVIQNTGLMGRWQVLRFSPMVICDTAHNSEGISQVMDQVRSVKYNNLHMVIGFVSDKDLSTILPLLPVNARYYFTRAKVMRAMDPEILAVTANGYGLKGNVYSSVRKAYLAALKNAKGNDLIYIGGSTFVVAEVV